MENNNEMGNSPMPEQNHGGGGQKPKGFMATLEYYLAEKAPHLPKGLKKFLVTFIPWINIIFILMSAPMMLGFFGIGLSWSYYAYGGFSIMALLVAVQIVLGIIALPGLFKRQIAGWNFSLYAVGVGFIANLFSYDGVISAIIGTIISLYILFQIRSYYK